MYTASGYPFSGREREILGLAAQGLTDKAIAIRLGISEPTVSTYWSRIRIKMGPLNRTELVLKAMTAEAENTLESLRKENHHLQNRLNGQGEPGQKQSFDLDFEELLEGVQSALVITDEQGRILLLNHEAACLFGYEMTELRGHNVSVLVPERLREEHVGLVREYLGNPTRKEMGDHLQIMARKKDGSEFHIAASLNPINTPHGLRISCLVSDVSVEMIGQRLAGFVTSS